MMRPGVERGATGMEQTRVFETYTLSRSQLIEWPSILGQIRALVEQSEIKIVDIKRHEDRLTIIFRRLR